MPPIITTLRADIVPHREMAIRKWYTASRLWYYHRRSMPSELQITEQLYQMIDPDLQDLCRLLHEHDIRTTPSCQGHFYDREYFREVWDELEREESAIQSEGLPIVDSESGREFTFRAETFELPWLCFEDFFAEASARQTQGYLGILLPRNRHGLVCQLHNHPYRTQRAWIRFDGELSCALGGSLFGITVQSHNPGERMQLWRNVKEYMQTILAELEHSNVSGSLRRA